MSRNQREMAQLRNEVPAAPGSTIGCYRALVGLSSAIPDALTLTSLRMVHDGGVEFRAMVVGAGFSQDELRQEFARAGFSPRQSDGWSYDSAKGILEFRGSYRGTEP